MTHFGNQKKIFMKSVATHIYEMLAQWIVHHGLRVVVIIVLAWILNKLACRSIEKIVRKVISSHRYLSAEAERKREDTLIRIFNWTSSIAILLIAAMMVLQELGVPIGPLLAGAGIVGIAIGFGGQYVIRDLISGFFIILENQYRIGDVVSFDGTDGLVEDISLRMTTLRNQDGTVHHVPHGEIKKVSNLSKDFSRINLNVGVSYEADLEKVISVINQTGKELAEDPQWKKHIITPPQFLRVQDFGDSALIVKILGETQPLMQWDLTGELRKRLKIAFDKAGIEIPYPQSVVHNPPSSNKVKDS
jgi:small-conductance mechanosensitive channel